MLPEEARRRDTQSWLGKAHKDLRYADIDLAASPPAPEDALFHCQQAAEKGLKAFLVWHDQPFPKTHDLGKLAMELEPTLEPLIEQVVELTKYAWLFRYPGEAVEPVVEEATGALAKVRGLIKALVKELPREARTSGVRSP